VNPAALFRKGSEKGAAETIRKKAGDIQQCEASKKAEADSVRISTRYLSSSQRHGDTSGIRARLPTYFPESTEKRQFIPASDRRPADGNQLGQADHP
jgi:hypothetical protein